MKHFAVPYQKKMISKGELDEELPIIELNDVESRTSIVLYNENGNPRVTSKVESSKLDFADCDIVFNRLEPYLGKILINDHSQDIIGTSEWIPLKFKPRRIIIIQAVLSMTNSNVLRLRSLEKNVIIFQIMYAQSVEIYSAMNMENNVKNVVLCSVKIVWCRKD